MYPLSAYWSLSRNRMQSSMAWRILAYSIASFSAVSMLSVILPPPNHLTHGKDADYGTCDNPIIRCKVHFFSSPSSSAMLTPNRSATFLTRSRVGVWSSHFRMVPLPRSQARSILEIEMFCFLASSRMRVTMLSPSFRLFSKKTIDFFVAV